jgi:hypothetical protein
MRVLIACEYSGRTREAFRARGHDVISCDILPAEDNSPYHIVGDVFDVIRDHGPFDLMIAHPPCTYLANSGVRWLFDPRDRTKFDKDRFAKMVAAAQFFADLYTCDIPKIAIENPIMHSHARLAIELNIGNGFDMRAYTQFVQPWWYGDRAFKATGFTLKNLNGLEKPPTALTPPAFGTPEHKEWSVIHNQSPGPNRWKERSRTFPGIAKAMAEAWG